LHDLLGIDDPIADVALLKRGSVSPAEVVGAYVVRDLVQVRADISMDPIDARGEPYERVLDRVLRVGPPSQVPAADPPYPPGSVLVGDLEPGLRVLA
jgi:hypothetical protein